MKSYDATMSIVAKRVFVIEYQGQSFGSSMFKSLSDFDQYRGVLCQCCPCVECFAYINGCSITINGCEIQMCGCASYSALLNGCQILINGCEAQLN